MYFSVVIVVLIALSAKNYSHHKSILHLTHMKKLKKWLAYLVVSLLVIIVAGLCYVSFALPNVGKPEDIKVALTPQRIEHGKYLANHITICMDCHSPRNWQKFGGPPDSTKLGVGGEIFDANAGFPGKVYVPNITPYNLKNWTDGEIFRAITCGVKKDGSAIFPLMPWQSYAHMDREDIYDIIAYIRTLPAQASSYPARQLNFPLNFIVNTIPEKASLGTKPHESDVVKYGGYLVRSAACANCHTAVVNGKPVEGMQFAGGRDFQLGSVRVRSANITPDATTGIGKWSEAQFLARFRSYADGGLTAPAVKKGDFQIIMPWWKYGGMKESDLKAIYAYLKTVKPIKNDVVHFEQIASVK